VRDHEVDLLIEDVVLVGHRHGDEEDAEDVVAVSLERRSRLVLVLGRRKQALDRRVLELLRRLVAHLLGARIEEVDPRCGHVAAFRHEAA